MSSIQEPQIVKPKDPPSVKIKEPGNIIYLYLIP